jgi:hypothetical protein
MQSENTETPKQVVLKSTDRRPLNVINFTGGYNNCLGFIHRSIKPLVGIVKYDFSTWRLFPKNVIQAKELAQKWALSFEKRKDFVGKSVVVFFHLQYKTIRIEVKEKHNYILENENIVIEISKEEGLK